MSLIYNFVFKKHLQFDNMIIIKFNNLMLKNYLLN